jgi:formate dehydrogenase subunit delta
VSKTSLDKLVYMANQIAREFTSQHPREAVQATYDHLWHFWDPRMRARIADDLANGGDGLSEVARQAVEKLVQSSGEPRPVTKATRFNKAVDPGGDPTLMSDAG